MARLPTGFTTRASCLLAAGITAILCGLALGEIDLLRAGVLAAAIPIAASVVMSRSRVRIASRRQVHPVRAHAGQAVTVRLTVTNQSRLPTGVLMLEDGLPDQFRNNARFVLDSLISHEVREVSYRMPAIGRGRYRVGPLRVRLCDPFRMIELTRSFTATSDFIVLPVVDQLPALDPPRSEDLGGSAGSHSVGAHGADDASTREYRTGDDLRKIHWRSSARTGALMVRQEEQPWRGQTTLFLDLRATAHTTTRDAEPGVDPRTTSSFEWAVSAAASIGVHALHAAREVDLIGAGARRARIADAEQLLAHLAVVRETSRPDLTATAATLRTAGRDSTLIAIVGRLDAAGLTLLREARPRGRMSPALAIVVDVDSWQAPIGGRPDAHHPDAHHPDAHHPDAHHPDTRRTDCEAAAAALHSVGWRVAIARRGDPVAQTWQLLFAGTTAAGRR